MTEDNMYRTAKNFFQVFEPKSEIITGVKVPGSVQVLGEAPDFNKGRVISANLNKDAVIMAQKRRDGDRAVQFYAKKYDEKIRLSLNEPQSNEEYGWANFISSTLFMLEGNSKKVNGMNVFIDNMIPDLFDANSIEALEVGAAKIASRFSDWELEGADIAHICAEGEKNFMGREKSFVKYLPLIFGKKGTLAYYDVAAMKEETIEADLDGHVFVVLSSGLKKKQLEAKKKAITEEVKESIEIMRKNGAGFESLDALSPEELDEYRSKLSISQRRRCAFFISENERAEAAKNALLKKDFRAFADVINDSQKNIKNRLEMVEGENEILIDMIQDMDEVKAVRMLNMGLDGSVILLVKKDKRQAVESRIKKIFLTRTGLELSSEVFDLNNETEELSINVSDFKK